MTLRERLQWVMETRGLNPNSWSSRAGLNRSALRVAIKRAEKEPDISLSVETLVRLADSAGVSFQWLAANRGEPFDPPPPEPDMQYPSRALALAAARVSMYEPEALTRVAAVDDLPSDPGFEYWIARVRAEHELVRASSK